MKKVQKVYNPQKDEDLEILNFVLENAQEDTYGFVVNAQLGKMIFLNDYFYTLELLKSYKYR